jgi:hypothetical protein
MNRSLVFALAAGVGLAIAPLAGAADDQAKLAMYSFDIRTGKNITEVLVSAAACPAKDVSGRRRGRTGRYRAG